MGILNRFRRGSGKEIPQKPNRNLREWGKADPKDAEAHFRLGFELLKQNRLDEAVREYRDGLRINPNNAEAHYKLGLTLMGQGKMEEALEEYKGCLVVDPNHADGHNKVGLLYGMQGKWDEAIGEYQKALRINPNHANAHYNLGQAYLNQRKLDDAVREYNEALRIKPDHAEAHNSLGCAYAEQGKIEEAVREYKEAIRIDPNNARAISNLANTYQIQKQQTEPGRIRWMALDYKRPCPNCGIVMDLSREFPFIEDEHGCYGVVLDPQSKQESRERLPYAVMRIYERGDSKRYTIEKVLNIVGGELIQVSNENWSSIGLEMSIQCDRCGGQFLLRVILATAEIRNAEEKVVLVREKQHPEIFTFPIVFLVCSGYMHIDDIKFLSPTSG